MAKSFASASTDRLVSAFTTHATQRSYSMWAYRLGSGGGGLGRLFDKRVSSAQVECLYHDNASNIYNYSRTWASEIKWNSPQPSLNAWHNIIITYDGGSTSNDAKIYYDGVSQTVTRSGTPSGSLATNADAYVFGNRNNDNARNFNGYLCEFAIWDRILTADEINAIGAKKFSPAFFRPSLKLYIPLIREINDLLNAVPTLNGTTQIDHPLIIYPTRPISRG